MNKSLSICSWNVRGLGQASRRDDVLAELISVRPTIAALQETKLPSLLVQRPTSFLPSRLRHCVARDSTGASGGILTAWSDDSCCLRASSAERFTLTTRFILAQDTTEFTFTNVYAPASHEDKRCFFSELAVVAASVNGPWMVMGDFNLTRDPGDKNNGRFNYTEANEFNELINTLCLIEIPLTDRAYTWSNKRDEPTLVRLDRCFVNVDWDAVFPNTTLSSLTRFCSDHVPLLLTASTRIPRSACFRFENSWLLHRNFRAIIHDVLARPAREGSSKVFVQKLKHCRGACRSWAKRLIPIDQRAQDTRILINILDLLEEQRALQPNEKKLRCIAIRGLQDIHAEKLAFWRQRFHVRLAVEWDENSRFFHAAASGRRRRNNIAVLECGTVIATTHSAKSAVLHNFYSDLLGKTRGTSWNFDLGDLYPSLDLASHNLSTPFTTSEITAALFAMDMHASPGLDGFGPSFYKHFWSLLQEDVATGGCRTFVPGFPWGAP